MPTTPSAPSSTARRQRTTPTKTRRSSPASRARWALEIGGDYALVIDGSLDQFEAILRRALAKVTAAKIASATSATERDLP